ncbi:LysM peptidoglycan-binding domain-containing protein [Robertmurraya massiliosenegalensis]|uniref:C40 family peptidase n=1 Tax=Robertmurraya TaxID=2837507 RepID=UPI0039A51AAB
MKKKVAALTSVALLSTSFATTAFADTYKVEKGDTLTQIAKKYSTSVSSLKTLNKLSSDMIYINQVLQVSASAKTEVKAPTKTESAPTTVTSYTIVKGDTLSKIAKQHNITLSDLMKWNNLDHHIIYPGQKLKVSNSTPTTETKPQPEQSTDKKETTVETATSTYLVQKGDTLSHISKKFGTTVSQLKSLNGLKSDLIFVGQTLKVSGKETIVEAVKEESKTETTENVVTIPASAQKVIEESKKLLGVSYVWAGSTPAGFDCSGFIYYAFKSSGVSVSRLSTEGYYSRSYYVDAPQPGDLVFFENTYKSGISHMGIYLGENQFIHASSSKGVMISSLNEAYYQQRFDGFKRFY